MNHCTESAVKTVFATCSGLIDPNLGFRTQNPGDGQNLGFRCACQGENVGVLTFECGEFVLGYRLAARKEATEKGLEVLKDRRRDTSSWIEPRALKQLQNDRELEPTGVLDRRTVAALGIDVSGG